MFYCHSILSVIVYIYQDNCLIRHVNPELPPFCYRYARRPDQWRSNQTSKEATQRKFQVEFGSNSKPGGQNIEDLFSSQTPTKKRTQKEKTDKITEDFNASKQDERQEQKAEGCRSNFRGQSKQQETH
jgi:hypothetical protein